MTSQATELHALRQLSQPTTTYLAGLDDVLAVMSEAGPGVVQRYARLIDHISVTITQLGYVGTMSAISDEVARLLGEEEDETT